MVTIDKAMMINKESYDESFKKIILGSYLAESTIISVDDEEIKYKHYIIDDLLRLFGSSGEVIKTIDVSGCMVVEEEDTVLIFTII